MSTTACCRMLLHTFAGCRRLSQAVACCRMLSHAVTCCRMLLHAVFPPGRSWWQFSVTRLEDTTSDDAVRHHLQKAGVEVKEVWLLRSKIKRTKTAKVKDAREHRDKAINPALGFRAIQKG